MPHRHDDASTSSRGGYTLGSGVAQPDTDQGQRLLAAAYLTRERPRCPCTPGGAPMYIARAGHRLIVKRMPNTGPLHDPDCHCATPADPHDRAHPPGDTVRAAPDPDRRVLRLGFRLSVTDHTAADAARPGTVSAAAASAGERVSLLALLDHLWEAADLVAWSPGMAGRRHWGLIGWLLRRAAATIDTTVGPLTDRLYVPEPFRLERKDDHDAARKVAWQAAATRVGHRQQLMILIAEATSLEPARYGHKLILKHLPDVPLFLPDRVHRMLTSAYAREIAMWHADTSGHLIVIATFRVGRGGSATADDAAVMTTTAQWLPYRDPNTKHLLDALTEAGHRFRVTSHRDCVPADRYPPAAVLTGRPRSVSLHIHTQPKTAVHSWTPADRD